MDKPKSLKDELLFLSQTDLVRFEEIDGVAQVYWGYSSRSERWTAIIEAVMELLADGLIEIGDAVLVRQGSRLLDGFIDFRPWQGGLAHIRSRLEQALSAQEVDHPF